MGTIYAIANQKGGVGKTTTAVNIAACVADAGYETLLVDLDAQCNATVALNVDKGRSPNVYDVLAGDLPLDEAALPTDIRGLSIVPSTPDLAGANIELPRLPGSETRLRDSLGAVRERFLFTILDCPPSLGPAHRERPRGRRPRDRAGPDRVLRARGPRRACSTRCR